MANYDIAAVNCISIQFLLKHEYNYSLLSFEKKLGRIIDDSVVFIRSYPDQILPIIFGHGFLLCTTVVYSRSVL